MYGIALYVGAILGTGILVLPALAAQKAGPASLIAWAGMLLVSMPTAFVFSRLGATFPDGGGISFFVRKAFGDKCSAVVGWCFYFALAPGVPTGALIGGDYAAAALGGGRTLAVVCAAVILIAVFFCNYLGLRVAGGVQMALMALLVIILVTAIAVSAPHVRVENLTPFAPRGASGILAAAGALLYSFVGWEAVTPLSAEFRDPARQLRFVTICTFATIAALYLSVAVVCVLTLGPRLADTSAPLAVLLDRLGPSSGPLVAIAAILLTFGSLNTYIAGAARLGETMANEGAIPSWFGKKPEAGQIPRRSLGLLAALVTLFFLAVLSTRASLGAIITFPSSCYITVTVGGLLASIKLLPRGFVTVSALTASFLLAAVLLSTGWALTLPLTLTAGALLYRARNGNGRTAAGPQTKKSVAGVDLR
jgi:amino acid efflux transporter